MTLASATPVISLLLIPLLATPPGWSQAAFPQSAIQLKIVDSDGSQVAANSRSTKGFYVEVTNGNGGGVPDAAVALRLPDSGASGIFPDGSHSAVVYTDASGKAHVDGIQWNATPGALSVRITATKGDDHAGMLLEETLVSGNASVAAPHLEAAVPTPVRPAEAVVPAAVSQRVTPEDATPLNTIPATEDGVPIRPAIRAAASASQVPFLRSAEPSVSISNDGPGPAYHGSSSKKKWVWIGLAIVAGAGAAYAISTMSKAGSSTASSSSIGIGAPTVSVGHP